MPLIPGNQASRACSNPYQSVPSPKERRAWDYLGDATLKVPVLVGFKGKPKGHHLFLEFPRKRHKPLFRANASQVNFLLEVIYLAVTTVLAALIDRHALRSGRIWYGEIGDNSRVPQPLDDGAWSSGSLGVILLIASSCKVRHWLVVSLQPTTSGGELGVLWATSNPSFSRLLQTPHGTPGNF